MGRGDSGVCLVRSKSPGDSGSECADAQSSGILMHAYLASFLRAVRGQEVEVTVLEEPQANSWQTNPGTETTGLGGKHSRCPGSMGQRQEACLSDKAETISCWKNSPSKISFTQHVLELVAWMQPQVPRSGVHTPRRCRVSHGEATGSISFNFWKNEKCLCHSDRNAGVTVCEAVPLTDGLCLVWSLSRAMAGHGGRGDSWESLRAEEE